MKQATKTVSTLAALLSLTTVFACGDDDDKGSSSSGVSSSKQLSDLTDSDADKLCDWYSETASSNQPSKKQICTLAGAFSSSTEAECKEFVAACEKSNSFNTEFEPTCDIDADALDSSSCEATVGELEACQKALVQATSRSFGSMSCADAGNVDEGDLEFELPAACEKLEDKCPDVSDAVDVSTGAEGLGGDGPASGGTFSCGDGSSIDSEWVCDGVDDCDNGRDESSC